MRIDDGNDDTTFDYAFDNAAQSDNPATAPPDDTPPPDYGPGDAVIDTTPPPDYGPGQIEHGTTSYAAGNTPQPILSSAALTGRSGMDPSAITAAVANARARFGLTLDDTGSDVDSIIHLAGGDASLVTQATIDRFVNAKYPTWAAPTESHGGRGGDADLNYDGIADSVQAHVVASTTADTYDGVADWMTAAQIATLTPTAPGHVNAAGTATTNSLVPITTPAAGARGTTSAQPTSAYPVTGLQLYDPTVQAGAAAGGAPSWLVPAAIAAALLKLVGAF